MTTEKALTEIEAITARVRGDLASAGFTPVVPDDDDAPKGGVYLSVFDNHVHVFWGVHNRLGEAASGMMEAGRLSEDVVCQFETTRAAMHLALGSILNAFGYRTKPHSLGYGHFILPDKL
jgi:hypothetical protein